MEFKRCFYNKKLIFFGVAIMIAFLVLFSENIKKSGTQTGGPEEEYYYQNMQQMQGENLDDGSFHSMLVRVFSQCDKVRSSSKGVVVEKADKTEEDFRKIMDVETVDMEDSLITNVTKNLFPVFVSVLLGLFLVSIFQEERKRGMWWFVSTTVRGREKIFLSRIGILLVGLTVINFVMYVGMFLVNWHHLGKPVLSAPIQSVDEYQQLILKVDIKTFILIFIMYRILTTFMIIVSVYVTILIFDDFALGVVYNFVFYGVEYLIYKTISYNDEYEFLKNFNLYNYIDSSALFKRYRLFMVAGSPVSYRVIMLTALCIITLLVVIAGFAISKFKKPVMIGPSILEVNGRLVSFGLRGFEEFRKNLIYSMGIVFLLLAYVWAKNDIELYPMNYFEMSGILGKYFKECEVKDPDGVDAYIAGLDDKLAKIAEEEGEESSRYIILSNNIDSLKTRREYVRSMNRSDVKVLDDFNYKTFFCEGGKITRCKKMLMICLIAVFLNAGIYAYERKAGVVSMVNSLKYGKKWQLRDKIIYSIVVTSFVYWVVMGYYMYETGHNLTFMHWNMDIHNVELFRNFPLDVSIGTVCIAYLCIDWLCCLIFGLVVMFSSKKLPYEKGCIAWSLAVLIIGMLI